MKLAQTVVIFLKSCNNITLYMVFNAVLKVSIVIENVYISVCILTHYKKQCSGIVFKTNTLIYICSHILFIIFTLHVTRNCHRDCFDRIRAGTVKTWCRINNRL